MPGASALIRASPLGRIVTDLEQRVSLVLAVPSFAGPHGVITCPVEDRRDRLHGKVRGNHCRVGGVGVHDAVQSVRDVPDRATRHHHVPGGRADPTDPGSHVVGSVKDHAPGRQGIEIRSLQRRLRIIDLQVKWRLVVGDDEQDVGPLLRCRAWEK